MHCIHYKEPCLTKQPRTHLSVDPEGPGLLVQLDGGHSRNLSGLLNIAAVAADGETYEVFSHGELLLKR